jgi:hypothetical protein
MFQLYNKCGRFSTRPDISLPAINYAKICHIDGMEAEMETKDIRQSVMFKANAHAVYELLMDPKKHSELAGMRLK